MWSDPSSGSSKHHFRDFLSVRQIDIQLAKIVFTIEQLDKRRLADAREPFEDQGVVELAAGGGHAGDGGDKHQTERLLGVDALFGSEVLWEETRDRIGLRRPCLPPILDLVENRVKLVIPARHGDSAVQVPI